ncbi:hypothetical protein [Streptomyces sp. NBC_01525]|uniref:hypothetical protein n=1 Tax=Streptomyces sp. NBC_01525 TaxID=2903893 RepID=UPI003864BF16
MVRNVCGSLIALIGATAAVWSPFRPWYDGRPARDVRIEDLFGGLSRASAELLGSVFLPMLFAALLTLVGVVLRSRALVALAGLVVLGFTILWMVRQGQAAGSLTAGPRGGLGDGVAVAFGGGLLLLLAALVMRGRHTARGRHARGRYDEREDRDARERRATARYDASYDERAYGNEPGAHGARPAPGAAPWDPGRPPAQEWRPPPPPPGPPPEDGGLPQRPTPPVRWAEELRRHPGGTPQAGAEEPHAPTGAHASEGGAPGYGAGPAGGEGPHAEGPEPAWGESPDATVPFPQVRPGGRATGTPDGAAGPLDETVQQRAVRPDGPGEADAHGEPGPHGEGHAPGAPDGPAAPEDHPHRPRDDGNNAP